MRSASVRRSVSAVAIVSMLAGCQASLTREEAAEALDELEIASQSAALMGASVEVATDFTIGGAVEAAATQVRAFVETQLPCAEVTVAAGQLSIEYGARPGACTFRGQTFSGSHTIAIMRTAADAVEVRHTWDDFSNGTVSVDGDATVTWSAADPSRRVEHELTWTRLADGKQGVGSGDRTQRPLDGDLAVGFEEEGTRTWEGDVGTWTLDIEGVEMRWADPVPQAGSYTLTTPADKTLSVSFARKGPSTITVTLESGRRSFSFDVLAL
jgi:hypothetical protein